MTKKQKDTKMEEMQQWIETGVPKEAKDPSSELDNLHIDVIDIKQREEEKALEVMNGNDVQTVLSDSAIKTVGGGYEETKKAKKEKSEIGREKSGR